MTQLINSHRLFLQADFIYAQSDCPLFGFVSRPEYELTVISSFWGKGPADAFLRETFGKGIQEVADLWDSYITRTAASMFFFPVIYVYVK